MTGHWCTGDFLMEMGMFKSGLKTHCSKYDGSALDSDYYMRVGEVDFLQIRCQSACTQYTYSYSYLSDFQRSS